MKQITFLTAEWKNLLMANYAVDPSLLAPFVPAHTELDLWNNTCYVSLVGFRFLDTKVKGMGFPFYRNFCEINLRFYVRHNRNNQWYRGVVFIRELVPKKLITFVANTLYNENYRTLPLKHTWTENVDLLIVNYRWKHKRWNSLEATCDKTPYTLATGTEEEFITHHYLGYTKYNRQQTLEYKVEHPTWNIHCVKNYTLDVDFGKTYGEEWNFLSHLEPRSVFLADGSEISVSGKRKISSH